MAKHLIYSPEAVAAMEPIELELCFDFGEDDVVFGFSPESLRAACDADPKTLRLLMTKLTTRVWQEIDDNTIKLDRPGYSVPLTDREFVKKLLSISKECFDNVWAPSDAEESGYATYLAKCEHRRARHTKPVERVEAETADGVAMPAASTEPAAATGGDAIPIRDPVCLKAKLYNGQLNVSHLFCGSQLLSGSRHTRGDYSAKNPLLVTRISGIKTGTTTVTYQGEELRTPDVETWVAIVRLGSTLPLGTPVHLKEGQLLKALRRTDGHLNYVALRKQLARLQNAKLTIDTEHPKLIASMAAALPEDPEAQHALKTGKLRITVSLLGDSSNSTPNKRGCHLVHLPPNVRALFGPGLSSWFREDAYYGLKNPTARRLYLLYGRHVEPLPFTLPELREYLGMSFDRDDKLLDAIQAAHEEMFAKGYLVGTMAPEYSTHFPKTAGGLGGGLKRGGKKAFAIALVKGWAPAQDLVEA
jgi:hypothetical protein